MVKQCHGLKDKAMVRTMRAGWRGICPDHRTITICLHYWYAYKSCSGIVRQTFIVGA